MDEQRLAQWLDERGAAIAGMLEANETSICTEVSTRIVRAFPDLCFDPNRPDAQAFQQLVVQQSPRRFHRLLQSVLIFQTLTIVTQEYTWLWGLLPGYGVTPAQPLAVAGWYFTAAQSRLPLTDADADAFAMLKRRVLARIRAVVEVPADHM